MNQHDQSPSISYRALLTLLRQAVRDAVVPSATARVPLPLPAHFWVRWPAVFLLAALGFGFTGGSIAIPIAGNGLSAWPSWLLGLLQSGPLVLAVVYPLLAWRITAIGMFGGVVFINDKAGFWPWPVTTFLALTVILFLVAVSSDRRTAVGAGVVTVAGLYLPAALFAGMPGWFAAILSGITLVTLTFGDALSGRYAAEATLAEQAEQHRRDLARQAVLEERARIARELHDVVAHHMSVIAMQAEAAPYKIPDLPDAARETFGVVRDAARDALTETRRVVGLLRAEDEEAERRPQPGLDLLDELVGAAEQAGLSVSLSVVGVPRPVSAGVDLSAYRIVQESLSNASKYAPGGRVLAEIRYRPEMLEVSVIDDGPRASPSEPGGGHGLVGMKERVTMLGGRISAGPRSDDAGWVVVAEIPYGDDSAG